ncbi:hypothetical protein [Oricola sp.]|uniref:tetratricopeptide repeat protein n=1 Tax=Oricola sp. TaxID=1979950 RepID=UPI0025EDFB0A|nr:hypothetical protein [Oricola sp.]MCI5074398.1 hypothetical protein [Oricola sp.]
MAAISQAEQFDPAVIQAELDRIVKSETFARSERSRELLSYIVERDLNGEADRLKGFSIALDVFDREDNFDPSTDAVVRVQAGRLRDLLATYYADEGVDDPIRISIPRGSYVPAYEETADRETEDDGEDEAQSVVTPAVPAPLLPQRTIPASRPRAAPRRVFAADIRLIWLGLSLLFLLLAGNAWMLVTSTLDRNAALVASEQPVEVEEEHGLLSATAYLPSISIEQAPDGPLRVALEDAIPRFGSVVYKTVGESSAGAPKSDFYIRVVPVSEHSSNIQFYHRESGILIGTDQAPSDADPPTIRRHVSRIASRFLSVGGQIYAFLETDGRLNALTECLVLANSYFTNQSAEKHVAAYHCGEDLVDRGINSGLVFSDLASLSVEYVTDGYDNPFDIGLDEAIAYGRRAIQLSPGSPEAYRSLAWAMQIAGEDAASLDLTRAASVLNPYDLSVSASYAGILVKMGDFQKAVDIMEDVLKAAPVHPTWWDFTTFLAAFQVGRYDLVSLTSRNLVGHERSHYCAARLIAASLEGNDDLRDRMLSAIDKRHEGFVSDPAAFYGRMMPQAAADKLVAALREAGLMVGGAHGG